MSLEEFLEKDTFKIVAYLQKVEVIKKYVRTRSLVAREDGWI
jgi:hypothetical protein